MYEMGEALGFAWPSVEVCAAHVGVSFGMAKSAAGWSGALLPH